MIKYYISAFPIAPYYTLDNILSCVATWLASKGMKEHIDTKDCEIKDETRNLSQILVPGRAATLIYQDHTCEEQYTEITVDIQARIMTIKAGCKVATGDARKVHIPSSIRTMLSLAAPDNGFETTEEPLFMDEHHLKNIEMVASEETSPIMPVIIIPPDHDGFMNVDFEHMAKCFAGRAHVVVMGDLDLASEVNQLTGGVVKGYREITLLFGHDREPIYIDQERYGELRELEECIEYNLEKEQVPIDRYISSFTQVASLKMRECSSRVETDNTNEEVEVLRTQLRELQNAHHDFTGTAKEKIAKYKDEAEALRREIEKLQIQNDHLSHRCQQTEQMPLLFYGDEEDYYTGEVRDTVIECITECAKRSTGRAKDILEDIAAHNISSGQREKRKKEMHDAMIQTDGELGKLERVLQAYGFKICVGRNHMSGLWNNDPRYHITFSKTPISSLRATKNMVSEVFKVIFG